MAKLDIDFLVNQRRRQLEGDGGYEQRLAAYRRIYEYSKNFESGAGRTYDQIRNSDTNKRVTDYFEKNGIAGAGSIDTSGIVGKQRRATVKNGDFRQLLGRQTQKSIPTLAQATAEVKKKNSNAVYNEPRAQEYERLSREYQQKADDAKNRSTAAGYRNTGARSKADYRADLKRTEEQSRQRAQYYRELAQRLKKGENADAESSYFESWNRQIAQHDAAAEQAKQTETLQFAEMSAGQRGAELERARYNLQKWTEEKNHGHSSYPEDYIDKQIEQHTDRVQRLTAADEAGKYNDAQRAKEEDARKYQALSKDELKRELEIAKNSRRVQEELQSREWYAGGTGMSFTQTLEYYDDRIDMLTRALYERDKSDRLKAYTDVRKNADFAPIAAASAASTAADKDVEAVIDVIQSGNSDGEDARKWRGVSNVGNKAIFAKKLKDEYEGLYGTDKYADIFGDVFNKLPELNSIEPYSWLTDEEYSTYNYLYTTKGEKTAEEYFSLLEDDIDERRRQGEKAAAAQYAKDKPVDATIVSIGTNLFGFAGIMDTVGEGVRNLTRDVKKPLNANGQAYSNAALTETMRGTVQEDMSDVGQFFYGVATSAADNLTQTAVFGQTAAPIVMSGSAATSTFYDLSEQGVASDKASAVAIMAGVFEFAFERMGLDRIFDPLDNAMANYPGLWHYLKDSIFSEFSEEAGTEAANILTSALLLGKDSEWAGKLRELNELGISDGEALRQVLADYGLQIVEAGLAGAVTGGVLGGYNALTTGVNAQNTGAEMTEGDVVNVTLSTLESSSTPEVADLARTLTESMREKINMGNVVRVIELAKASTDVATVEAGAQLDAKLKNALMKGRQANITAADIFTLIASADENVRHNALDVIGLDLNIIEQIKQNALESGEPRARRAAELLEKTVTGKGSTAYERGLSYMQLLESIDEMELRQDEQTNDANAEAYNGNAAISKLLSDAAYDAVDAAYGRGEGAAAQDITAAYDVVNESAVETHPYDVKKVSPEYINAVDERILDFVRKYETLKNENYKKRFSVDIGSVDEKTADTIKNLTGSDVTGYVHSLSGNRYEHIKQRHGIAGTADHSLADVNDIARIGYVLNNYDSLDLLYDKKGNLKLSDEYKDGNNNKAKQIVFKKKIDGTYYVVEAVTDGSEGKIRITSAYINKNGIDTGKVLNISEEPQLTPETLHRANTDSAFDTTLTEKTGDVNNNIRENTENDTENFAKEQTEAKTNDAQTEVRDNMPDEERQRAIEDKTIKIVPYSEGALTEEETENIQKSFKRELKNKFKKIGERLNVFKQYENKDVAGRFVFSKNSIEESGHKQTVRGGTSLGFIKMLTQFDSIVENAALIETHTDKYAGTIREDLTLKRVYVLLSAYEDGGIVPVQLEVKEYTNKDNKLYMAVTLNKISAEVKTLGDSQNANHSALSTDTISVRDLVEKINPSDGKFLKYIPDGMLNEEQTAAKRAAMESEQRRIEGYAKKEHDTAQTPQAENGSSGRKLTEILNEKYGEETAKEYENTLKKNEKWYKNRYGVTGDFSKKINELYGMISDEGVAFKEIEKAGMELAQEMIETAEGYSAIDPDGTLGVREQAAERLYKHLYNGYLRLMGDAVKAGEAATGILNAEGIITAYDLYPGEISDAVKLSQGKSTGHKMPANYNAEGINALTEYFKAYPTATEAFSGEYNIDDIKQTAREMPNMLLDKESIKAKLEGKTEAIERLEQKLDEKDAQIFRMRERQREQAEKKKQTETNRRLREDIRKSLKDVVKRIETPTPQKHIPAGMEGIARELIDVFELDGQERQTNEGRLFRDRVNSLGAAVTAAQGDIGDPAFAEVLHGKITELQSRAGDIIYLSDANEGTLRSAKELSDMLKKGIAEADETHAMETKRRVSELAQEAIGSLEAKKKRNAVSKAVQQSSYNFGLMDHAAFFDLFGKEAGTAMRECFDGGLEKYATNVREVAEYMSKVIEDNKIDVRKLERETRKITLESGEVEISVAQLMELYELSMRPEAQEHLLNGSVVIEKQNKLTGQWEKDARIRLEERDYATIREALTETERNVANAMQKYMAFQDAMKGNETSRALYGFDRYQVGGDYWTMRVDKTTTNTTERNKATGTAELYQKPGFSHQVDAYAKNPLLIRGAFDTFVQHSLQMAAYNAFAPVTSDAMKLLNYRDAKEGTSFKSTMESTLGREAQKFYEGLIQDVNGMSRAGEATPLMGKLYRNAKAAAIMANISVIVQQPTAYMRAAAIIDPKYLAKGMKSPDVGKASERTERMHEYAPMTYWKSVGGADINTGKSMSELILDNGSGYSKVQNFLMAGAGKADDITWSKLWNACLWEATDKGIKPHTDEWYNAARKRLNEIIDYTQVIDSPLHRSQMMKSKGMTQLFTQFMSEPVKSVNVMRRAITEAGQLSGKARAKPILRSATSLLVTGVVNSAVKSVIYALRDSDDRDDEGNKRTYWDKWLEKFKENELDELNFINNFPVLKELWAAGDTAIGAIKGENAFSSGNEALYEKGIGEIIDFISALADDEKSGYDKTKAGVRALSTLSGMGVYNIWRDVEALINTLTPEETKLKRKFRDSFYGQEDTLKEILDMYMIGNNKVLKKDTPPDRIKSTEGEEIVLTKAQKEEYREAYNVAYSQIADAVRLTDVWEKLTDKQKSTALEKIKTQAAQEGRYAITGYPTDEDGEVKRTSIEEYAESCIFTALTKGEKKKAGKIAAIEKALGVNAEEANYYYQLYGEHEEEKEARSKARKQLVKDWKENDTQRSARAAGLTEKEYESYKKGLSELESTKDADGKSLTGSLTAKKLAYISRQVKDDKAAIYLAKEATSGQTRDIIDAAETAGALDREFIKKLSDYSQLLGEKDEDGDTISNSKKAAQLEWISNNCTEKQSAAFLKGALTSEKQSTVAEIVEKCGMSTKKFSEYLSGCVTLTGSKKINDYLYSISGSVDLNMRDLLYLATANTKNEYNVVLNRVVNKLRLTEGEKREYIRKLER